MSCRRRPKTSLQLATAIIPAYSSMLQCSTWYHGMIQLYLVPGRWQRTNLATHHYLYCSTRNHELTQQYEEHSSGIDKVQH